MAKLLLGMPLLERYRALGRMARDAQAALSQNTEIAADAVYQLRLCLRICRILKRFVRNHPGYLGASVVLDHCYRATGRVRDLQVGVMLIQQLELGWPRNRRRPSTALRSCLRQNYRSLKQEVDALGLEQALFAFDHAFSVLCSRVSEDKLHARALRHAQKLANRLSKCMRQALAQQQDDDWHRLRVAIKHYRFWVNSLADWLPESWEQDARGLKPLQVTLGHFHDWVVLEAWLPTLEGVPLAKWLPLVAQSKQQALDQLAPLLARETAWLAEGDREL